MRRPQSSLRCVLALCVLCAGCATFSRDLDRARAHYDKSEFPEALALLRVLADDQDALSAQEQAEYIYLRGMTDLRLAAAQRKGPTQDAFRASATQYLHKVNALVKDQPYLLTPAQHTHLDEAIAVIDGHALPDSDASSDTSD